MSTRYRLELVPDGHLAIEIGDCEAVLYLTPTAARKMATLIRAKLGAQGDLREEHVRIHDAIRYQRRKRESV